MEITPSALDAHMSPLRSGLVCDTIWCPNQGYDTKWCHVKAHWSRVMLLEVRVDERHRAQGHRQGSGNADFVLFVLDEGSGSQFPTVVGQAMHDFTKMSRLRWVVSFQTTASRYTASITTLQWLTG